MIEQGVKLALRKPGRPAVDRRAEILDTAHRLYDEIGFDKTTIGDIARRLSMSPANIYRNFPNRRAIDEAIAERRLSQIEEIAWTAARARTPATETLRKLVQDVLAISRDLMFGGDRLNALCAVAAREHWPVVTQFIDGLHGAVRHVVMEGQRTGDFGAHDPEQISGAIVTALLPVWHPVMIEANLDRDLPAMADQIVDLTLLALMNKTT